MNGVVLKKIKSTCWSVLLQEGKQLKKKKTKQTQNFSTRTMHKIWVSGNTRPLFYLHETWINQNHTIKAYGKSPLEVVD